MVLSTSQNKNAYLVFASSFVRGGSFPQMQFLDSSRGYIPVEELAHAEWEEMHFRQEKVLAGEEYDSARCRVGNVLGSCIPRQKLKQVRLGNFRTHMKYIRTYYIQNIYKYIHIPTKWPPQVFFFYISVCIWMYFLYVFYIFSHIYFIYIPLIS